MYVFLVKSLKFICVLNLGVFAVYIFCCENLWVFGFISFATSFQARVFFNLSAWHFVIKHRMFSYTLFVSFSSKMEDAILLSTSLDHGTSRTWFFLSLSLPWLTCVKCKCKRKIMQAMTVCSHLRCICIWMCWCCSLLYFIALAFECEPGLIFGL